MKRSVLWKVSVTTSSEADDAIAEWLGTTFGQPASSYTDAETLQATVSVYLRNRPRLGCRQEKGTRVGGSNGWPAAAWTSAPAAFR